MRLLLRSWMLVRKGRWRLFTNPAATFGSSQTWIADCEVLLLNNAVYKKVSKCSISMYGINLLAWAELCINLRLILYQHYMLQVCIIQSDTNW